MIRTFTFLVVALASVAVDAATYHVGNSLTWDALYSSNQLAGSDPSFPARGYHIRCGGSLPYMWNNPQDVCVESPQPYGMLQEFGDFAWDAITLQPFLGATLATDAAAIDSMIDMVRTNSANANVPFYVYATWPQQPWGAYKDFWTGDVPDVDSTPMRQRRGYYDALFRRVDEATDAIVRYVPSGESLYKLSLLVDAGELPGVTSMSQFYRDDLHLSDLGQYVTATTMFATLNKQHPDSVWTTAPAGVTNNPGVDFAAINQTIWGVIMADARTGLVDFNDDGMVNDADLSSLLAGDMAADADLNGVVDGQDFLLWQQHAVVATEAAPELTAVPEPSLGLWLVALAVVRRWRT